MELQLQQLRAETECELRWTVSECSHCGFESPVGGLEEYKYEEWFLSARPGFRENPTYSLCKVCRSLVGVPGNMSMTCIDTSLKDHAKMTNMVLKAIDGLVEPN